MGDVSNKFLSIEIAIPFVLLAVGGLVSWGSLSADMDHKAEAADVAVLKTEVSHIKEDVGEVKETVKEVQTEQKEQREILNEILRAVE